MADHWIDGMGSFHGGASWAKLATSWKVFFVKGKKKAPNKPGLDNRDRSSFLEEKEKAGSSFKATEACPMLPSGTSAEGWPCCRGCAL